MISECCKSFRRCSACHAYRQAHPLESLSRISCSTTAGDSHGPPRPFKPRNDSSKPRRAHWHAQGLRLVRPCHGAAVVVGQEHHWAVAQVGIESAFAADVHIVDLDKRKYLLARIAHVTPAAYARGQSARPKSSARQLQPGRSMRMRGLPGRSSTLPALWSVRAAVLV